MDIKKIANYYGYEAQSRQLIEECGELIQAINKFWRCEQGYIKDSKNSAVENILEEIADVEICIEQVKYLLREFYVGVDKRVVEKKEFKIVREIKRMEALTTEEIK